MRGWIKSASGLIKPAAPAGINANVAMALGASTSVTPPTHASGDYLFAFAYRDGNNNTPTLPAGWTALSPTGLVGASTNTGLLAYKIAASSSETCTGWTNATGIVCAVVKQAGAGPLGLGNDSDVTYGSATSNLITYTGITLASGNSHSVVLGFFGQRDTTGDGNGTTMSDMTHKTGGLATSCIVGGHATTQGVASFATRTFNHGGSGTTGFASATVEITGAA